MRHCFVSPIQSEHLQIINLYREFSSYEDIKKQLYFVFWGAGVGGWRLALRYVADEILRL